MRVTFLGREIEHRPWVLSAPAGEVVPTFVAHPEGAPADAVLAAVGATDPEVVVALSPRDVPGEALAETGALTLAVLDEEHATPGVHDVWDVGAAPLPQAPALPAGYDRVLTTDPLLARAAGAWRSAPLPVDDARYCTAPATDAAAPRIAFVGEETEWRGYWLADVAEHYDLRRFAHGAPLDARFAEATVGVCVRPARGRAGFPAAALLHLAAGHLLLSEPLRPLRGLEPGLDHIALDDSIDLMHWLYQVELRPAAFEHVRLRGRARMELFRASAIWPRVLADLAADVAAYGRGAAAGAAAAGRP